ncbi:hypothetical protein [Paenibacillus rubinfantis]|uniref:hypothetical protein n=1 Tax=Paenibacillus rubinfantis TaxID=1720296 RepID=UPI00073EB466|nr:hypothetical protein [Paenibacillus rubinfantis]
MVDEKLISELEFVLTHPSCSVERIENFYNNCLMLNESVPIYAFVTVMKRINPGILQEWSNRNATIRMALDDLGVQFDELDKPESYSIHIQIDLSRYSPSRGLYKITWQSEMDEKTVNRMFKRRAIKVTDRKQGVLELVGFRAVTDQKYTLYIKAKEESA